MPGAYLDHAATTPMCPEALAAMEPFFGASFANPSSSHAAGRAVRRALDDAREELAERLVCEPENLVFTSGGTEADNLAILGVGAARKGGVLVSAIEHKAVLEPAHSIGAVRAPVRPDGIIDLAALSELVDASTALVSVMAVNNEIGVIEPLDEVAALVRERAPEALVHTDAVQAFAWCDVATLSAPCDLVSLSAHKFGGPKGIGALIARARAREVLTPTHLGGAQERGWRAGTENVAGIVAMAAAARVAATKRSQTVARVTALRDRLVDGLLTSCPGVFECAPREKRIAGSAHLVFPGIDAEELLIVLDQGGVAASGGSACASGALEPSHVVMALGHPSTLARCALRLSLGATTTPQEIDHALVAIPRACSFLSSARS